MFRQGAQHLSTRARYGAARFTATPVIGSAIISKSASARPVLTRQASLVMAQDLTGSTPDSVRTLVTAPNAAMLAQSVNCLVDPRVWQQISGKVSVLNAAEGAIVDIPVENARLVATQPLSIDNMRLIAAGWLSLNRNIYVLLAFILALVLACHALVLEGRGSEGT